MTKNLELYMGLSTFSRRKKKALFKFVLDIIRNKIRGCKCGLFSQAGKEVLLKAIIHAILIHAMSYFQLPKSLVDQIHKLMNAFWWGSMKEKKKTHLETWENLCKHKPKGGLGFRDLEDFNRALLAKKTWNLLCFPNNLVNKVLRVSYCW